MSVNLAPFQIWEPRKLADPRGASAAQFMHGLCDILAVQGPMQGLHLFQTYAKAGGLIKITTSVRGRFERVVKEAAKSGDLLIEIEDDSEVDGETDSRAWIIRLPSQPQVMLRTLGPRSFAEIPMGELAALVLELRCQDEFMGREEISRAVLSHYGLQKLTSLVERRLAQVFKIYF